MKIIFTILFLILPSIIFANNIKEYEYWFNGNYSNKISDTVESNTGTVIIDTDLSISSLPIGTNVINFRFKDSLGRWSVVNSRLFITDNSFDFTNYTSNKLIEYEYWLDTNFSIRKTYSISPSSLMLILDSIDLKDISPNVHSINYRFKDSLGKWSVVRSSLFFNRTFVNYSPPELSNNKLTKYRWWFNQDLTTMEEEPIDPKVLNIDSLINFGHPKLDTSTLNYINIQFLDSNERWSVVVSDTFLFENYKVPKPTLLSPSNNALVKKDSTVKWKALPYISKYQLLIATDSLFNNVIVDVDSTINIEYHFNLYAGTTFYWKVKAYYEDTESDWSDYRKFKTKDSLVAPTLQFPSKDSIIELSTDFKWRKVSVAKSYIFELSMDQFFENIINTIIENDTIITSNQLLLSKSTKYYWRVKAVDTPDTSDYSEVWNFSTIDSIIAPTLVSVANNSINQLLNIDLKWNEIDIAEGYIFQLASDNNFTNIEYQTSITDTAINASLMNLLHSSKYFWRVKAFDFADTSDFSEVWNFTTKDSIIAPTLVSVANNSINQLLNIDLKWNVIDIADGYIFQLATDNNFANIKYQTALTDTSLNTSLMNLLHSTKYFWRVKAYDFADTSDFSEVWNFTTKDSIIAPTLVSVANNSTNQLLNIDLKWNEIDIADGYIFQLATDDNFSSIKYQTTLSDNAINTEVMNLLHSNKYYWRVKAFDFADTTDYSEIWNFTTKDSLVAPTLVSVANNITNQLLSIDLKWNEIDIAEGYILQLATDDNFENIKYQSSITDTLINTSLMNLLHSNKYFWRVKAFDFADTSDFSEVWNFTTKDRIIAPTLVSVANNSTNQLLNIDLKWNEIDIAEGYLFQLASDNNFANIKYQTTLSDTAINTSLMNLLHSTKYFWRVKAFDFADTSDFSEVWTFTTKDSIVAPTLVSVANHSINQLLNIDLKWNEIDIAEGYLFQLASDNNFANIKYQTTLSDTAINTSLMNLLHSTKYFWRVKAFDFADTSDFSEVWNFKTTYSYGISLDSLILFNSNNLKLYGNYNISDESEIIHKGFCLSKESNPDLNDTLIEVNFNPLNSEFYNLEYNTNYYVRAFIKTNYDIHYSNEKSIKTDYLLNIPINKKWNLISANILNFEDSVQTIFNDIKDSILIIKDNQGKVYIPSYDINQINILSYRTAYLVYSEYDLNLKVVGKLIDSSNKYIDIKTGWNLFPYLLANPQDVSIALKDLADSEQLLIIKDLNGNVFIPSYNINTLGDMIPGKGYYLYSLENVRFYYKE